MLRLFGGRKTAKTDEYIAVEARILPSGPDTVFVHDREGGHVCLLPSFDASLLPLLSQFRTAGDHLSLLSRERGAIASNRTLEEAFRRIHASGLLRTRSQILAGTTKNQTPTPPNISTIVWPTLNRNKSLSRSIEDYIAHNKRYGRKVRYLVVDNSINPTGSKECKQMLASIASGQKMPIHYCGIDEKRRFNKEMVQKSKGDGIPRWLMEFALIGESKNPMRYGVARNAILLATAGEMFLSADDDTLCRFAEPPSQHPGVAFSSTFDPTDVCFFPNRKAMLDNVNFKELDILAQHESLLGRAIADCLPLKEPEQQNDANPVVTARMSPRFARLASQGKGRVALTAAGICGDSAMSSAKIVLQLEGQARESVLDTKNHYDSAVSSREILRAVTRKTISDGSFFMTVNVAIDNQQLLPPFFTTGRNEEGIFALILRTCFEETLIGYLPICVYHDPPESRLFEPERVRRFEPGIGDMLVLLIETFNPPVESAAPIQRLQDLGQHLKELGALPPREFEGYVRFRWMAYLSSYINLLDDLLSRYGSSPDYWARDILALKDSARVFMTGRRISMLGGGAEKLQEKAETKRIQQIIGKFGELLYWWSPIVALARKLHEDENGLAVRL